MSISLIKVYFKSLSDRLNRFPQGTPLSETLYKILSILYSEKEAELISKLPIKPFTYSAITCKPTGKVSLSKKFDREV